MRKHYLDNIRWMTVVLVVIYHVFWMYNGVGVSGGLGKITNLDVQYYDLYLYIVYPWMLPVLFLVSGISARYSLQKYADKEFFKNRTVKLLVPVTIGLFVFHFIQGYISMALSDAFETTAQSTPKIVLYFIMVAGGIGVMWYMQMLWIFSGLLLLIRKIEKEKLWNLGGKTGLIALLLMAVPLWAFAQVGNTPVVVCYRFGFYGLLFFLGYYVFSHDEVMEKVKRYFLLFLGLAVALGIAFCVLYFGQNYADAPVYKTVLFTTYGWFGCLAILGGAARYLDLENTFTHWMGAHSFGLYIFHELFISGVALFLAKPGLVPPVVAYLLSGICGFAGGYGMFALISRIPVYRWCVLGMRGKKKD
ncbi:MAG: acyltransferase [Lachnospiraceae bacterium]|nr:acyltransferase [Lachnospiraceae bacterium]